MFRFRFATLLRMKRRLEEAAQMELGALKTRREEIRQRLAAEEQRATALHQEMIEALRAGMDASDYEMGQQAIALARVRAEELRQELAKVDLEVRKARHRLTNLYRERKLLENLRERDLKRHIEEESRKAQAEMDELASIRRALALEGQA